MKFNLKSIVTASAIACASTITFSTNAMAEVDKSQPIQLVSSYSNTGGTHGLGNSIVDYLEDQGWTNINGGRGFQSAGGCANLLNIEQKASGPIFWLQDNPVLGQPEGHPCHVEEVKESEFVTQFAGWTDFICSRKDLDLPPIDEATGTVRIAVDTKEYFGETEEEILRAMAPDANIILMRYGGSGGALQAVQAKEVQYTWSSLFDGERSEFSLNCDYNTSDQNLRGTVALQDAFPEIDFSQGRWISFKGANWNWLNASNASDELKAAFAEDFVAAFEEHQPTIDSMEARGYLWPTPTSELDMTTMEKIVGPKWVSEN